MMSPMEAKMRQHALNIFMRSRVEHTGDPALYDSILTYAAWMETFLVEHELGCDFAEWLSEQKANIIYGEDHK